MNDEIKQNKDTNSWGNTIWNSHHSKKSCASLAFYDYWSIHSIYILPRITSTSTQQPQSVTSKLAQSEGILCGEHTGRWKVENVF